MISLYVWTILGVISSVLLVFYWRTRNAVWGGLTIGVVVGLIIAVFSLFERNEFTWFIIGKSAIFGTIIGFAAELLGKTSDFIRKKNN